MGIIRIYIISCSIRYPQPVVVTEASICPVPAGPVTVVPFVGWVLSNFVGSNLAIRKLL